ncbi:hypothetical protein MKS88_005336 [Plasmodium brasilianum]|uniref:Uncharacterized protein n=2 Tax=Plasmodium (Plasmodium) TaxID=418103 RepID=A0A1A8WEB8_PLAMA|nr:conserved Plasmodium protein, unknown function [Plasmodium malariae]KAI4834661.1 hypothetical protein MKS88_005336 [Plasmodium brasilianum]SBS90139.1 conserved Plasmodium protein, unknown function [Plasmodium malariae]SCP03203.1 conserved Plasmodium protein, unknown function [Plasmodium malariae]
MDNFLWKEDNIKIEEYLKKKLDEGVIKEKDVSEIIYRLKEFRSLKFDNLNYHSDKCILAREVAVIYMMTYKKHIESLKDSNIQIIIKTIRRTVLSINNIISNITEQILKCFIMLRNLYSDILKLNNVYLSDYCLYSIIDGILGLLNDEKINQSNATIWGIAGFLSLIISNYKKAYFIYKGIISYKCIFTIPIFLENSIEKQNNSKEELHNIILKENDEHLCSNYSRIEAYVKLHLSLFIILNDTREIWSYLSEILNSAFRRKTYIYFCLIYSALNISSYYCKITFGHHFDNLMLLLKMKLIPILEEELKSKPPPTNVEKIIDYYVKKLYVEHLNNNLNSTLPDGIVVIPDEKLLYLGLGS